MTSPLNTLDIIIIHREKGGKPDSILPFNGHQAAHLTACVNLARAMLATEKGEQSFITLGDKLHRKSKPHQWLGGREMKVIVKAFLDEVKIKWPPLFIEETMENPDLLGATFRTVWPEKFDTRQFPISLNAGVGR